MMRLAECLATPSPFNAATAASGAASWAVGLLLLIAVVFAAPARADVARATAGVSTTIIDDAPGIQALSSFTLPSMKVGSEGSAGQSATGSSGDTQLTISGKLGDTLSVLAPSSFTLVRDGGNETVTAMTRATAVDEIGGQDLMTGDGVMRGDTMKVDIGLKLTQASGPAAPAGAYRGQFLVLIQYN